MKDNSSSDEECHHPRKAFKRLFKDTIENNEVFANNKPLLKKLFTESKGQIKEILKTSMEKVLMLNPEVNFDENRHLETQKMDKIDKMLYIL